MEQHTKLIKDKDLILNRLQSSIDDPWCKVIYNELTYLSSLLSSTLPIYSTRLTRTQLISSIKKLTEYNMNTSHHILNTELYHSALINYFLLISLHTHKLLVEMLLNHIHNLKKH